MIGPGPRNLITDVTGILVGNAEDSGVRTGVTVVLPDARTTAAVDVRGGAPGTCETDALSPSGLVDAIDAVVLSGGSVFGLEAAPPVVAWLAARGRGYRYRAGRMPAPIVPAAVLFDLLNGGDKDWGTASPYRRLADAACAAASADFRLGNSGAGFGAKAGDLKGGLGSASAVDRETGATVGAVVAVNALGTPVMPGQPTLWAWMLEQDDELGGQPPPVARVPLDPGLAVVDGADRPAPGGNTTIGVVALDAAVDKGEAQRLATMAQDGLARAVRPSHTPFDGDTLFVLSTGAVGLAEPRQAALARLGAVAADVVARALARGVFAAEPLGALPSYRALHGAALRRPG